MDCDPSVLQCPWGIAFCLHPHLACAPAVSAWLPLSGKDPPFYRSIQHALAILVLSPPHSANLCWLRGIPHRLYLCTTPQFSPDIPEDTTHGEFVKYQALLIRGRTRAWNPKHWIISRSSKGCSFKSEWRIWPVALSSRKGQVPSQGDGWFMQSPGVFRTVQTIKPNSFGKASCSL